MLDKKAELMLSVVNTLTADDLDYLRSTASVLEESAVVGNEPETTDQVAVALASENDAEVFSDSSAVSCVGLARGEHERRRTRESKIATACVGSERKKHDWWPIGTELIGRMGPETFTAVVVENPQVKSGRSIQITSGPAAGAICKTPTRAALEATEAYRQANNLGRSGGVTNGWQF